MKSSSFSYSQGKENVQFIYPVLYFNYDIKNTATRDSIQTEEHSIEIGQIELIQFLLYIFNPQRSKRAVYVTNHLYHQNGHKS